MMNVRSIWRGVSLLLLIYPAWNSLLYGEVILPTGDIVKSAAKWETTQSQAPDAVVDSFGGVSDPVKGDVLKLAYDLKDADSAWVNFATKTDALPSSIPVSAFQAFKFHLKGDGLDNKLIMEVKTAGNIVYKTLSLNISTKTTGWETISVPFSDFQYAYDASDPENHTVPEDPGWNDRDFIKSMGFTIEPDKGGAGSITIDELLMIPSDETEILIDDAEGNTFNSVNGNLGELAGATLNQVISPAPYAGSYCREIISPATTGAGMWQHIYYNDLTYTPLDINGFSHLSFYLRLPSEISGDLVVAVKDLDDNEKQLKVQDYFTGGVIPVGSWKQVLIPLTDMSDVSIVFSKMGELLFVLPPNITIYLDDIKFINLQAGQDYLIDAMDTFHENSSWVTYEAVETEVSLYSVPGRQGNAIRMEYTFPGNKFERWANMTRGFGLNVLKDNANAFQFDYKGLGNKNNLEFKIKDDNDTVFRMLLENVTYTGGSWKTLTVLYDNLVYFSGSDKNFNFKNVTKMEFAISKSIGGRGEFYLDTIRCLKCPDFSQGLPSDRLITNFSIDNNPFAPQTDIVRSTAAFSFTLGEPARVWLKFYDLAGKTVLRLDAGVLPAGIQSIIWDGLDRNGSLVRNGLYLYQFVAEGQNATQKIKNIIGVVR